MRYENKEEREGGKEGGRKGGKEGREREKERKQRKEEKRKEKKRRKSNQFIQGDALPVLKKNVMNSNCNIILAKKQKKPKNQNDMQTILI